MTQTLIAPAFHHATDVVYPPGRIVAGVTVAHRRVTASVRFRQGDNPTRFSGWPACQPIHRHPCGQPDSPACEHGCTCLCDCVLPRWVELSAAVAMELGAVACTLPGCAPTL